MFHRHGLESVMERTPVSWWHNTIGADGKPKVVCTLCPRECHIPPGGQGFCFVRANVDGRLELTTYGRSSGFCIDPIEKKPLHHLLPGTSVLSFGTAGCNLGCKFCQNWDISKSRENNTMAVEADPETIVAAALEHGCRSLAFTYNDPVIWAEYAIDVARCARQHGLKTVAVTAGYISAQARETFFAPMDAANVDLKGFEDSFYRRLCQGELQPVLDTLRYLVHETSVWVEITNLLIPGENDSLDEIKRMSHWIATELKPSVPLHFTAFHPDFKMLDTPATPPELLRQAREIALREGLQYVYVGNVHDENGQNTCCPQCGRVVIARDLYELHRFTLRDGCCPDCDTRIPGVFENQPGHWGARRQRVHLPSSY